MKIKVTAYHNGEEIEDYVAFEKDMELVINNSPVATIKLSPGYEKEFALGYCLGEGFISGLCDVKKIVMGENSIHVDVRESKAERERYISSECLSGWRTRIKKGMKVESDLKVKSSEIIENMKEMQRKSEVWKLTGGVHSSALVIDREVIVIEDVSRHVTIDKLLGIGLKRNIDFSKSYILTSGRIPGDMVTKIAEAGIPLAATRTAVLYSGINVARKSGITLVGFVRKRNMNIYTCRERIV
ncbi:MAG TPA: formate dehydrogenase accessory sulfurtransferase FdhD [Euryarchaeota archaeon]|nr:formate dehydrogenase accessory sulfurtransferase FdhD [Euryarchaeota archaeon]